MRVVGIDPGLKGALACVDTDTGEVIGMIDMPTVIYVNDKMVPDAVEVSKTIRGWSPDLIILEHIEPRADSGRSSEWSFAQGFGATLAACQIACDEARTHLVRPAKWKKAMSLSADKALSLTAARAAYPDMSDMLARMKDDGRAEALLLVEYYRCVLATATEMEVI